MMYGSQPDMKKYPAQKKKIQVGTPTTRCVKYKTYTNVVMIMVIEDSYFRLFYMS